jgi:hypothetical protein
MGVNNVTARLRGGRACRGDMAVVACVGGVAGVAGGGGGKWRLPHPSSPPRGTAACRYHLRCL